MSFIRYIILIIPLGVNAILSVDEMDITENSATLTCELPCFSSNLQCVVSHFITSCTGVNVTYGTRDITGSMAYSYPTQTITLRGLNSDTTYSYCIVATNITNMMIFGEPVCDSFTTQKITTGTNEGITTYCTYVGTLLLQYTYVHMYTYKFNIAWVATYVYSFILLVCILLQCMLYVYVCGYVRLYRVVHVHDANDPIATAWS